jgi:guanosine-3',5'-bis(diphosphate) 3'-pyrophosphohydrolase
MHVHQLRKDNRTPYIAHPFRVAMTVRDVFGEDDPEILAAALLHDVIEDTTTDYDDVRERFGPRVADLVAALTKDMRLPESSREAAYDQGLMDAEWGAKLIKLADVYDNLCDKRTSKPPGIKGGKADRALTLAGDDPRLARAVAAVRELVEGLEPKAATSPG